MKKQLMHLANALRKSGLSLSDALKRAWQTLKLKAEMLLRPASFFYRKDDGSERFAVGHYAAAPQGTPATERAMNPLVIPYYDTLSGGWRSFRADRLISY